MKYLAVLTFSLAICVSCDSGKGSPTTSSGSPISGSEEKPKVGGSTEPANQEGQSTTVPAKGSGSISGKALVNGPAQSLPPLRPPSDCQAVGAAAKIPNDQLVVTKVGQENRIQWVAVYLSKGVSGRFAPPKQPGRINQVGCMYDPHVVMLMAGQVLQVRNGDPLTHNIHGLCQQNAEFNFTQGAQNQVNTVILENVEKQILIKCDIHPHMRCWGFVLDHPFFAATGPDGTYTIQGVPAGAYEITFWHERFGSLVQPVQVEEGKVATVDAVFTPK